MIDADFIEIGTDSIRIGSLRIGGPDAEPLTMGRLSDAIRVLNENQAAFCGAVSSTSDSEVGYETNAPVPRKESWDDFQKRSSALLAECQRRKE